jgi:hypothetical protein
MACYRWCSQTPCSRQQLAQAHSGTVSEAAYINSVLAKPCGTTSGADVWRMPQAVQTSLVLVGEAVSLLGQPGAPGLSEGSCCSLPSDVRGRKAGDSVSVRYNLLSMSAGGGLSIEPESVIDVAACALAAESLAAASASWN